ncbi:MAG: amidohydrolase family protein, partial [Alphaproteobacteria bacterium]
MQDGTFKLPAGSSDCHVHVYGPFDRFPPAQAGRFSPAQESPVEKLLAIWDAIGISRGVIAHALGAGENNRVTLDALRRHPSRLRGVALVKSDISDAELDE